MSQGKKSKAAGGAKKTGKKKATDQKRYRAAVEGFTSVIHVLVLILVVLMLIFLGRQAYRFGYDVFNEKGMEAAPGRDVSVTIPEMSSAREIGEILKEAGLIEDVTVFTAQERLSAYHDKVKAGTYTLNTSMTPTQMLSVMGAEEEEES